MSATRCAARGTTPASACEAAKRCARLRWIRSPAGAWSVGARWRSSARSCRSRNRRRPSARPHAPASVVIVGGGGAGLAAADVLRREGCMTARSRCSARTIRRRATARTCRKTTWPAPRRTTGCRCGRRSSTRTADRAVASDRVCRRSMSARGMCSSKTAHGARSVRS